MASFPFSSSAASAADSCLPRGALPVTGKPAASLSGPYFVQLTGLRSKPELNGKYGLILSNLDPKAEEKVGRVPVQLCADGKLVSLRPANLRTGARDMVFHNSSLASNAGASFVEVIGSDPGLRSMDNCSTFARAVWETMFEVPPTRPLFPLSEFRGEVLGATGHKLFWFQLEAHAHHFLLEKCDGRYRLIQSYLRPDGLADGHRWRRGSGFTAGMWLAMATEENGMGANEAHRRFGASKSLGDGDVEHLFDLIQQSMELTDELVYNHFLAQVPFLEGAGLKVSTKDDLTEEAVEFACKWALEKLNRIPTHGLTHHGLHVNGDLMDGVALRIMQGAQLLLQIPHALAARSDKIHTALTGEQLNGTMFLRMVNQCIQWERSRGLDGGARAYTILGADLRHTLSWEEGQAALRRTQQEMKEEIGLA